MRRRRGVIGIAAALIAAAVLGVLAAAAFSVARDVDGAGARAAAHQGLPERVAERLSGAGNFLAFADALRLIRLPAGRDGVAGVALRRRQVESILERLAETGRAAARARALNLLAVMRLEDASAHGPPAAEDLKAAAESLARAARLDPSNEDAKFNLELLLTLRSTGATATAAGKKARHHPVRNNGGTGDPGTGY